MDDASGTGRDTETADDTGAGSGGADSTGNGEGEAGGSDTGGVGGEECQGTQQGLCENPGQVIHCYSGLPSTCDAGLCQGGTQTCEGLDLDLGQWSDCEGEILPEMEVCDGLDNDCDGQIDEALGASICGQGVCTHDVDNCVDGMEEPCDPLQGASDEVCDGDDNDCDGDIDEDFNGITVNCGVGVCNHDVAACVDGMAPVCDPFEGASMEVCDGLDNDCDGATDEGFGNLQCGVGVCDHIVPACDMGVPGVCDPYEGASPEICNSLDDDCDGMVDEGFDDVTCGVGPCEHTVAQCVGGIFVMCDPLEGAMPEICGNGIDDDCDGVVDNGCVCGNGVAAGAEQCDGADLNGATCVTLGHDGGTLGCTPMCTYDESGCYDCGNGALNPGEQCDGANLGGQTCAGLGFDGGALGCNPTCTFDTSGCYGCGDGSLDPGEACDGANLGGQTCVGLGFDGGMLGCTAGCNYDTSGCYDCGDGALNPGEQCDGANLGGQTCAGLGFGGGTLTCNATCNYNTSGCYSCGDGALNPGESCDGANLGGQTCQTLGFDGGTLTCNASCGFNTSGCYDCGDGVINPGESCDGAALGGQTCAGLGFDGGTLTCNASCGYDTGGCYECGDGTIDPGEQCDGANLGGQTCAGLGYAGGFLTCDASCNFDPTGCGNCGNGMIDPGEQCDGVDFGGLDCDDYGFNFGNLQCTGTCGVDTSNCSNVCEAPAGHLVCDAAGGNAFQALGLNCPGNATNSTTAYNLTFSSPAAAAWRVATQYGNTGSWLPREGNAMLIITTGVLPALDAMGRVVLAAGSTEIGTANANPGASGPPGPDSPVGLPAPITAIDGSNFGAGGTPFINCDGINDCSDSLDTQWINGGSGAYDLLFFEFDVDVPVGVSAFTVDMAWFDSEFPEWIGSQFTDVLVIWSNSEAYTGNVAVHLGESFDSNTAAPFVIYDGLSPQMVGTGYDGVDVGGGTGWYRVTGPTVPGEQLTLSFALFETGDHFYDATVLLDNFMWDCDGCVMGSDCLMVPAP